MPKRANAVEAEGRRLRTALLRNISKVWDGKACVLELQAADYQWRQMEWLGWWFEWRAKHIATARLGGVDGPRYGRTQFDSKLKAVWDFKAHAVQGERDWVILNDAEAVERCIIDYGSVGYVIASGETEYDEDGAFYAWHEALKGGPSKYTMKRRARAGWSRPRKTRFTLTDLVCFRLKSLDDLRAGMKEGWLGGFQEQFINSNDRPRRAKYKVRLDLLPVRLRIK